MATQFTPLAHLQYWQYGDRNWPLPYQATTTLLDGLCAIGPLMAVPTLIDGFGVATGLGITIAAGTFAKGDGTPGTFAGGTLTAPVSATTLVWLTEAGAIASGAAWPTINHVRIATVVAGPTLVTSITDARTPFRSITGSTAVFLPTAGGTMADGGNIALGTVTGTQLGTAVGQKLAFHGAAPIVQAASANQAAIGVLATVTITNSTGGTVSTILPAATNTSALTDSTGGTASTTLAAITDIATKNAVASLAAQLATQLALNTVLINAVASLAAQTNHAVTDFGAFETLVNELRSDLVNKGLIKGSA